MPIVNTVKRELFIVTKNTIEMKGTVYNGIKTCLIIRILGAIPEARFFRINDQIISFHMLISINIVIILIRFDVTATKIIFYIGISTFCDRSTLNAKVGQKYMPFDILMTITLRVGFFSIGCAHCNASTANNGAFPSKVKTNEVALITFVTHIG